LVNGDRKNGAGEIAGFGERMYKEECCPKFCGGKASKRVRRSGRNKRRVRLAIQSRGRKRCVKERRDRRRGPRRGFKERSAQKSAIEGNFQIGWNLLGAKKKERIVRLGMLARWSGL